ncbi:hypothetical protein OED01_02820 [Microbacterium sp. M28]|uniref:DUF7507 domain-containing protein n=1 Tax=Microbacterium sp. M28 TaxID=2962064 RepID=UPI0021F4B238|nr:hypothetical protein [Microbacterium sp. M28]UYO97670.1 hypothetical protein OED01_02820 [Microbacterium sp. M28]
MLTQADVDGGEVINTATATAQTPRGAVSDSDGATVAVAGASAISLQKQVGDPVDADGDGALGAGDTIDYTFTVSNTGTTTITAVQISDPMLGGAVVCPELDGTALAPGDDVACTPITYELTQEDVDAGTVHNEAAVTADAAGGAVTDTAQADATVDSTDAVELIKTATGPTDTDGDGLIGVGDEVSYTFTVRNAAPRRSRSPRSTTRSSAVTPDASPTARSRSLLATTSTAARSSTNSRRPTSTPLSSTTRRPSRRRGASRSPTTARHAL